MKLTLLDFEEAGFDDVNYWPHLEGEEVLKRKEGLIRRLENDDTGNNVADATRLWGQRWPA